MVGVGGSGCAMCFCFWAAGILVAECLCEDAEHESGVGTCTTSVDVTGEKGGVGNEGSGCADGGM